MWKGDVAISVHNSLYFSNTDIDKHCGEQDIEMCALKLSFSALNMYILTLYRAPSGNFSCFFTQIGHYSSIIIYYTLFFVGT